MANDVIFKLAVGLTDDQRDNVLGLVLELPDVMAAAPVRRQSTSEAARQLCFARLAADADADRVAREIEALAEVIYAEVPPKRTFSGS